MYPPGYLHIKPSIYSDHNNLQYSCNDEPTSEYVIPIVSIFDRVHSQSIFGPNPFKELSKLARNKNSDCHDFLMGTGKKFVMDLYIYLNLLLCYIHSLTYYDFLCSDKCALTH